MEHVIADSEFESFEFAEWLQGCAKLVDLSFLTILIFIPIAIRLITDTYQEDTIVGHLNNWNWKLMHLR